MKIFATSDIHGNKALVYLISQIVKKENIDALIIAGDIAPKGFYRLCKDGLRYDIQSVFSLKNREGKLKRIEEQVDRKTILITHGPPKGTLDRLTNGLRAGSVSIFNLVKDKQPIFHIFGHIHEAFGNTKISNTICCNASCLWTDWLLRGYIIDTKDESIKKIKEEINFKRRYGLCQYQKK